ncbi:MAG: ComEC/Rec2 family competence protein [Rickettsiales bacterium]
MIFYNIISLQNLNPIKISYKKYNDEFVIVAKYQYRYLAIDKENKKILLSNISTILNTGDIIKATYYLKPPLCLSKLDNCLATAKVTKFSYLNAKKKNILREYIIAHIKKYSANPLALALIAGYKDDISKEVKEVFFKTGTSHLLAISGLHIGGIALIGYLVSKRILSFSNIIMLKYDIRKIASFFSLLLAFMFLIISGFPISAQRAFLFIFIYFIATIYEFKLALSNLIFTATLIILLIDPSNLFKASFQMSFAAALALSLYFSNYAQDSYIKKLCHSSLIATIVTTPIVIFHFGLASIIAPLVNIIVLPLTSLIIMPAAIFCLLVSFLGLANYSFKLFDFILTIFTNIITYFSKFALLTPNYIKINELSLLLLLISLLVIIFSANKKNLILALIFYLIAYLVPYLNFYKPDLIITNINKIFLVKSNTGYLISKRKLNIYQEKYLAKKFNNLTKFELKNYANNNLHCNEKYCFFYKNNKIVTIINYKITTKKFRLICRYSDLVINYVSGENCSKKLTFNKFDLNKLRNIKIHLKAQDIKLIPDPIYKDVFSQ